MEEKLIKSYKGFNKDMKCRDFQYEVGKEYELDGYIEVCERGFHACPNPIDVFSYYPPATSRYCEVEQGGKLDESEPDKVCSSKIKIGAELTIPGIVKAAISYVRSHCTNEHNAEPGKPATAGYRGAATAGDRGAATAGDSGAATSRGSSSVGTNGLAVARGEGVKVKGGLGAILVIAEENSNNYDIKEWKAVIVDGDIIKADTWYKLINGEFEEVNP